MRAPSRKPPPPEIPSSPYSYTKYTGDFTNNTNHWLVITGAALNPPSNFSWPFGTVLGIAIAETDGTIVDNWGLQSIASGSPAPVFAHVQEFTFNRRMLVGPSWTVTLVSVVSVEVIQCATLEDALAIL